MLKTPKTHRCGCSRNGNHMLNDLNGSLSVDSLTHVLWDITFTPVWLKTPLFEADDAQ